MKGGPEDANKLNVKENEQLRRGKAQVAAPWDNHANHIHQHFVIMMDPAIRQRQDDPVMAATMQHVMAHAQFLFPGIQNPTDPRLMGLMGNNVQGMPQSAPAPEAPTPQPVANPMPVAGPHGAPEHGAPRPPHGPILPSATPNIVQNAATNLNPKMTPHMAKR